MKKKDEKEKKRVGWSAGTVDNEHLGRKNSKLEAAMERKSSKTNEEQERRESQAFRFVIRNFQNPHF